MSIDSQERDFRLVIKIVFVVLILVAFGIFFICQSIQKTMAWVILGLYAIFIVLLIGNAIFFSTKKLSESIRYKDDVFQQIDKFKAYGKHGNHFMIDLINKYYRDEGIIDTLVSQKEGIDRLFKRAVYLRNHMDYSFESKEVSIVFFPIIIGWILPSVEKGQEGQMDSVLHLVVIAVVLFLAWILFTKIITKEYDTRNEICRYELKLVEEKISRLKERPEIYFESGTDVVRQIIYVELRKTWCLFCCKRKEKQELLRQLDEKRDIKVLYNSISVQFKRVKKRIDKQFKFFGLSV